MKKIYQIFNTLTRESYIGATKGDVKKRLKDPVRKSVKKVDRKLHRAIGKFGLEAFVIKEIDTAKTTDELAQKEKKYILQYDSLNNGYNSDCGGGFRKTVYQYDYKTKEFVNKFDDLENASMAVKASRKSISNACLGYNKSCKGYAWSYTDTYPEMAIDSRLKPVYQYTLQGQHIKIFESLKEASLELGISESCIGRCCRGEREQTSGFKFSY